MQSDRLKEKTLEILMRREHWAKDIDCKECYNCDKRFNALFRWKHHCRLCGKIFCNPCSTFYINPCGISLDNYQYKTQITDRQANLSKYGNIKEFTKQKNIRFCQNCFNFAVSLIKPADVHMNSRLPMIQHFEDEQEPPNDFTTEDDFLLQFSSLIMTNQHQEQQDLEYKLYRKTLQQFKQVSLQILINNGLEDSLTPIHNLVTNAIFVTRTGMKYSSDEMDVNQIIKVKKIGGEEKGIKKMLFGMVFRKNFISKKMKESFIDNERSALIVLCISHLDMEEKDKKVITLVNDSLYKKEYEVLCKYVQAIKDQQVKVLFVQNTVSRMALDFLIQKGISVVQNIKIKHIKSLAHMTKAQIIYDISRLRDPSYLKQALGRARKIYTKKQETPSNYHGYSNFKANLDTTLLYIERYSSGELITLCIQGNSKEKLQREKQAILQIVKLNWNTLLEKEVVSMDLELQRGMKKTSLKQCNVGYIRSFRQEQVGLTKYIQEQKINYTKINYVQCDINKIVDLQQKNLSTDYVYAQLQSNKRDLKIKLFVEICERPMLADVEFYSNKDIALGHFIIFQSKNLSIKCETCNKGKQNHIQIFYRGNTYVKIITEENHIYYNENNNDSLNKHALSNRSRVFSGDNLDIEQMPSMNRSYSVNKFFNNERHTTYNQVNHQNNSGGGSNSNYNNGTSNSKTIKDFYNNTSQIRQMKEMKNNKVITHNHDGQQANDILIYCFIQCDNCGEILVDEEKELFRNYYDYSFNRYLQHLFDSQVNSQQNIANINDIVMRDNCQHTNKQRVFRHQKILIKMFVGSFNRFNLQIDKYNSKNSKNIIHDNIQILINSLKQNLAGQVEQIITQIIQVYDQDLRQQQKKIMVTYEQNLEIQGLSVDASPRRSQTLMNSPTSKRMKSISSVFKVDNNNNNKPLLTDEDVNKESEYIIKDIISNVQSYSSNENHSENIDNTDNKEPFTVISNEKINNVVIVDQQFDYVQNEQYIDLVDQINHNLLWLKEQIISIIRNQTNQSKLEHLRIKLFLNLNDIVNMTSQFLTEKSFSLEDSLNLNQLIQKINKNIHQNFFEQGNEQKQYSLVQQYNQNSKETVQQLYNSTESRCQSQSQLDSGLDISYIYNNKDQISQMTENNQDIRIQQLTNHRIIETQPQPQKEQNKDHQKRNKSEKENEIKFIQNSNRMKSVMNIGKGLIMMNNRFQEQDTNTQYPFISVSKDNPVSGIAAALNSEEYAQEVYMLGDYKKYQLDNDYKEEELIKFVRSKLCPVNIEKSAMMSQSNDSRILFKYTGLFTKRLVKKRTAESVRNILTKSRRVTPMMGSIIVMGEEKEKEVDEETLHSRQHFVVKPKQKLNVIVYYPDQFEALRTLLGLSLKNLVQYLSFVGENEKNEGGRTNSQFIKTRDQYFMFKQVQKKEVDAFCSFSESYFEHFLEKDNKKKEVFLCKILGVYKVQMGTRKEVYLILMENVFFGMSSDECQIFDLKGSQLNRLVLDKEAKVLHDTNFKIYRNGEPLHVDITDLQVLLRAVKGDTRMLAEQGIIDYSLLLLIDNQRAIIKVSVIDYLGLYTWNKKVEEVAKKAINRGNDPTIISPLNYRVRFLQAINQYFVENYN